MTALTLGLLFLVIGQPDGKPAPADDIPEAKFHAIEIVNGRSIEISVFPIHEPVGGTGVVPATNVPPPVQTHTIEIVNGKHRARYKVVLPGVPRPASDVKPAGK